MKIAIVGATGNAGTALLHALKDEPQIEEITGIARRYPHRAADPYSAATWQRIDVAAPALEAADDDDVIDLLSSVFTGLDAVVHLAWLIQPNRSRRLLRRTNVDGTRRVVEACLRAGVPHLVAASSVGAYSPVADDQPRDEQWETGGITTSHYAVDKAAQERVLSAGEEQGLKISRLRPALIFDGEAGAEVTRLFFGALIPARLLKPGRLPVVPLPRGVRFQVVHGADVADAYRRIILQGATGAFNVAAHEVLTGVDVANVLDRGNSVPLPPKALRSVLNLAWHARVLAADPGWLDMAMSVPVMDTSRAQQELGWQPKHTAAQTLREMLTAVAHGAGVSSGPLRPREQWPIDQVPQGSVRPGGAVGAAADSKAHRIDVDVDRWAVHRYLADHLTGATAGAARAKRAALRQRGTPAAPTLEKIAKQIRQEEKYLRLLIETLEVRPLRYRQAAAWLGEKFGNLSATTRPQSTSLDPALDVELLRSAIMGKLGGWQTLIRLAPQLGLPAQTFERFAQRGQEQIRQLDELHESAIQRALRS